MLKLYELLLLGSCCLIYGCSNVEPAAAQTVKTNSAALLMKVVVSFKDTSVLNFVNDEALYSEGWDTLSQPLFWKNVMRLSPDSAIINIADNRSPLDVIDFNGWMKQDIKEKNLYKQNFCCSRNLDSLTNLFVTNGRRDFFEHRKTLFSISKAVDAFTKYGVDPWYAETILLIESPGKNIQKSWAGAQGPFQLMREVAVKYGLKVNRKIDQRTDLNMSALAASKLINNVCIPKVRSILDSLGVSYQETDIWFRLLVLHAYHAGAGNIACALYSIAPKSGGIDLIQRLWHTECRNFKNESQNYSQLALAAHLSFNEILGNPGDTVFLVQGARKYSLYKGQQNGKPLAYSQLMECFNSYGDDLIDGSIDTDNYIKRINALKKEMALANPYSAEHDYLAVSNQLIRKRKVDEAIKLLRFTIEQFPQSAPAADSLSRAYKMSGNITLANKYEKISSELSKSNTQ